MYFSSKSWHVSLHTTTLGHTVPDILSISYQIDICSRRSWHISVIVVSSSVAVCVTVHTRTHVSWGTKGRGPNRSTLLLDIFTIDPLTTVYQWNSVVIQQPITALASRERLILGAGNPVENGSPPDKWPSMADGQSVWSNTGHFASSTWYRTKKYINLNYTPNFSQGTHQTHK